MGSSGAMRLLSVCVLFFFAGTAPAQDYPNRPIRMIVAFSPGGAVDLTGRLLARHLQEALGQSVVIDNKPGAGGIVASEAAAKSEPDGYTLYLTDNAPFSINPFTYKALPYDATADFVPIGLVAH